MLAKFKLTAEGLAKCYHWLLSINSGYSHTGGCWVDGLNLFNCKYKKPPLISAVLLCKSNSEEVLFQRAYPILCIGENKHRHFAAYSHLDTDCSWFFILNWRVLGLFVFNRSWNGRMKMYIDTAVLLFHLTTELVNDKGETILCGSRYRRFETQCWHREGRDYLREGWEKHYIIKHLWWETETLYLMVNGGKA